jgi:hypothetical protein
MERCGVKFKEIPLDFTQAELREKLWVEASPGRYGRRGADDHAAARALLAAACAQWLDRQGFWVAAGSSEALAAPPASTELEECQVHEPARTLRPMPKQ